LSLCEKPSPLFSAPSPPPEAWPLPPVSAIMLTSQLFLMAVVSSWLSLWNPSWNPHLTLVMVLLWASQDVWSVLHSLPQFYNISCWHVFFFFCFTSHAVSSLKQEYFHKLPFCLPLDSAEHCPHKYVLSAGAK
jgi:hypothetical protein